MKYNETSRKISKLYGYIAKFSNDYRQITSVQQEPTVSICRTERNDDVSSYSLINDIYRFMSAQYLTKYYLINGKYRIGDSENFNIHNIK